LLHVGYTFEADEMNADQRTSSAQRTAYAIEQGIVVTDDAPSTFDDDSDEENAEVSDFYNTKKGFGAAALQLAASKQAVPAVAGAASMSSEPAPASVTAAVASNAAASGVAGPSSGFPAIAPPAPAAPALLLSNSTMTPLERATALAQQLAMNKQAAGALTSYPQQPSGFIGAGVSSAPESSSHVPVDAKAALARAKLLAMQINNNPNAPADAVDTHFTAELDINDYPVQASCFGCLISIVY
jgi:hypothetical protein